MDPIDIKYFKMAVGQPKSETPTDISARCPICGDSKKSKNKARLHLYEKGKVTLVHCFNDCAVQPMTMYKFLKTFYPNLFPNYRAETFNTRVSSLKDFASLEKLDLLGDFEIPDSQSQASQSPKEVLQSQTETQTEAQKDFLRYPELPKRTFDISEHFVSDSRINKYCSERHFEYSESKFGKFFIADKNITIDGKFYPIKGFLVIPLYIGDKWYGFYSRSLTEHRFFTYIPDDNLGFKIWNLYNIDISKKVYVFEGIFDAIAAHTSGIENVVACLGATPPEEVLKNLKNAVMCFDNDATGLNNSLKYIDRGFETLYYSNIEQKDMNDILIAHGKEKVKEILDNPIKGIVGKIKIRGNL